MLDSGGRTSSRSSVYSPLKTGRGLTRRWTGPTVWGRSRCVAAMFGDRLQITLKNTSTEALSDLEVYYQMKDTATQKGAIRT
jgi:hypothetical protein